MSEVAVKPTEVTVEVKTDNSSTDTEETAEKANTYNYIFIGVLAVVLILLLYYAYGRFTENSSEGEGFVKGNTQERDDPVIDFNLREAIQELQALQRNIMSTISDNSDF